MKKLIPILVFLISLSSFSQGGRRINERVKAQKRAFITEKLNLSPEEAEKFWPIYNTFEATQERIKSKDLRAVKIEMRSNPDISDAEADKLLEKLVKAEKELHAARIKLVEDLKTVISSKKIILLKATEDEFNRKLIKKLKEYRDRRQGKN